MSNLAPGVYVTESTFPTYTNSTPTSTVAVFVGAHNQGPTIPTLVQSWPEFVAQYGGFSNTVGPTSLALAVYAYFSNGGSQAYILRVVHSDAVVASAPLDDSGAASTITVSAEDPGVWGNTIYVTVTAGAVSGTFDLTIYYGGTTANNVVERWKGLAMSQVASNYFASVINNPLNGSTYIRVSDLHGTLTAPGNLPVPVSAVQLGTGSGSVPGVDGTSATASDLAGTTTALDQINAPLLINYPGCVDVTNVLGPVISYVTSQRIYQDSMVIVDCPSAQSAAGVASYKADLPNSSYAAVYWPWVTISDPASQASGAQRNLPPAAFAMGQYAATDAARGVQKAPAGPQTTLNALNLERNVTTQDVATCTAANVNAIRYMQGVGIAIWGDRTTSNVANTQFINVRRNMIFIESTIRNLLAYAVFEDNDWVLWNQITSRINTFLSQWWASGGLSGSSIAEAFYIVCDATNNAQGSDMVNVEVGVAPQYPAEFIIVSVGQWTGGTTTVTETSSATASA